jgi:hypothetical protein
MTPKKLRVDLIDNCMKNLQNLSTFYNLGSPAWVLIQAAFGHIKSIRHLEEDSNFDEETLGAKNELDKY